MKYLLRHSRSKMLLTFLFATLAAVFRLSIEFVRGGLLNSALQKDEKSLLLMMLAFFGCILSKSFFHYLFTLSYRQGTTSCLAILRGEIFHALLGRSFSSFLRHEEGDYLGLFTEQMDTYNFDCYQSWYGSLLIISEVALGLISFLFLSPRLAAVSFLLLLPPIFLPLAFQKFLRQSQKDRLAAVNRHLGKVTEWIRGFEMIRSHHAVDHFLSRFVVDSAELRDKKVRYALLFFLTQSISKFCTEISLIGSLAYSGYLVGQGVIDAGQFMTSVGIIEELKGHVIHVTGYIQSILVSEIPFGRMQEIIQEQDQVERSEMTREISRVRKIDFVHVFFSYEKKRGQKALISDFSATLSSPGVYWLKGPSGCGKSTLMNLLLRYNKADSGLILANDQDVLQLAGWEKHLSIMRQEAAFLPDSLRNNLSLYQENITDEQLFQAMKRIGLDAYAEKECLDEILKHSEQRFSGGETKRLALIRALLKPSEILILDEPLANVDPESLRSICEVIFDEKERFVLLISHQEPILRPGDHLQAIWDISR